MIVVFMVMSSVLLLFVCGLIELRWEISTMLVMYDMSVHIMKVEIFTWIMLMLVWCVVLMLLLMV